MSKYDQLYMDLAWRVSEQSQAIRLQVGCLIVLGDSIIAFGWNGMPADYPNRCEHEVLVPSVEETADGNPLYMQLMLKSNDEVSHAEMNAIGKLAESTISAKGATLYCTHSPCLACAKLIQRTGIREVVYDQEFRTSEGMYLLHKRGLQVRKI